MTNFELRQKSSALSLYLTIKLFATNKITIQALDNVRCALKAFYKNPDQGMYYALNCRMRTAIAFYNAYH